MQPRVITIDGKTYNNVEETGLFIFGVCAVGVAGVWYFFML